MLKPIIVATEALVFVTAIPPRVNVSTVSTMTDAKQANQPDVRFIQVMKPELWSLRPQQMQQQHLPFKSIMLQL